MGGKWEDIYLYIKGRNISILKIFFYYSLICVLF